MLRLCTLVRQFFLQAIGNLLVSIALYNKYVLLLLPLSPHVKIPIDNPGHFISHLKLDVDGLKSIVIHPEKPCLAIWFLSQIFDNVKMLMILKIKSDILTWKQLNLVNFVFVLYISSIV